MNKKVLLLILLPAFISLNAQTVNLEKQIATPESGTTSREIIESLYECCALKITYQSSNKVYRYPLDFPQRDSITIKELLDIMQKNLPFEYIIKNGYIIFRKKDLQKKYLLQGQVLAKDSLRPLLFASVQVLGANIGIQTDQNGHFKMMLPPGNYRLSFKYMGYNPTIRNINLYADKQIDVSLDPAYIDIHQVEVKTYKKKPVVELYAGRSIETIDRKTIERVNLNNAADVLHGSINGVWSTSMSGAPGDHQKVRIRGTNSLFSAVDPLYVINGVPVPLVNLSSRGIADLNTHDIESITVLKDASSTSYYGYQGANGVVLIETKSGGTENHISFAAKTGLQQMNNRYDFTNTRDFLSNLVRSDSIFFPRNKYYKEYTSFKGDEENPEFYQVERYVYPFPYDSVELPTTHWQDELFQTGKIDEYQLSASGSTKGIDFYVSGNYFNHGGVITNSRFKKYTGLLSLSAQPVKKLKLDASYRGANLENKNNLDAYMGNKTILRGINIEPGYNHLSEFEKLTYRDYPFGGTPMNPIPKDMVRHMEMYPFNDADMSNLYINSHENGSDFFYLNNQKHLANTHNMSLRMKYYLKDNIWLNHSSSTSFRNNQYISTSTTIAEPDKYFLSQEDYRIVNHVTEVKMLKDVGNHRIFLGGTFRNYKDQIKWNIDSVNNIIIDNLDKSSDGYIRGSNALYGETGHVVRTIRSLIGQARYDFMNRYTFSFFANYDHLKEGYNVDVYTLFPSVAFNWQIAKEKWFSGVRQLSMFDVYINWGKTGNYPLNGLSDDLWNRTKYDVKQDQLEGKYISNLANHKLKHEEVEEINLGGKLGFFDQRLLFSANAYKKQNRNLIVYRDIPLYYGGGTFVQNLGEMENTGIEFSMESIPVQNQNFIWETRIGYSYIDQKIVELKDQYDSIYFNSENILIPNFILSLNEKPGNILGYQYTGQWTEADDTLNNNQYLHSHGAKYLNADTTNKELDVYDKTLIGNAIPDFTLFWNNTFQYKNLTIFFQWYAVLGIEKFNATRASTFYSMKNAEVGRFVSDSMNYYEDPVFYQSSYFIEDASFIRLKTLSFTYQPEQLLFQTVKTAFSISFENLITITRYSGFDPEASIYTDNNFSDNAVDLGAYPSPRSIFLGLNFTF